MSLMIGTTSDARQGSLAEPLDVREVVLPGRQSDRRVLMMGMMRPLRFAATGSAAALVQLLVLHLLIESRWQPIAANAVALALSTQVNFVLSYFFTWHDRRPRADTLAIIGGRWSAYQLSASGAALLNMGVFIVAHPIITPLLASALGTAVASVVNYLVGDRLVFRARQKVRA